MGQRGGGPALPFYISYTACARALLARPWSARCYGVARPREGSRQNSIGGPRDWLFYQLYTRARALLARPWSARCYGVARPREGSRPNSIGGLGRALTPAFRAGSLYPLILGAWVPKNLARKMVSAGAMLLDRLGPAGFRFIDFRAPRLALLSAIHAREGAAGQAVVCPLLRGSSPTRGVAPKQHRGPRDWLFYQLYTRARALLARPWSARCYGVARPREGSRQNSIGVPAIGSSISYTRARGRCWPGRGLPVATG